MVKNNQINFPNNLISPAYKNYNLSSVQKITDNNEYGDFHNDYHELKFEDLKKLDIQSDIDSIWEIAYKSYKKEFTKDRSFSLDSDSEMTEEIDCIINGFERRMKKRNDNVTDSLLSEIVEDLGKPSFCKINI